MFNRYLASGTGMAVDPESAMFAPFLRMENFVVFDMGPLLVMKHGRFCYRIKLPTLDLQHSMSAS